MGAEQQPTKKNGKNEKDTIQILLLNIFAFESIVNLHYFLRFHLLIFNWYICEISCAMCLPELRCLLGYLYECFVKSQIKETCF